MLVHQKISSKSERLNNTAKDVQSIIASMIETTLVQFKNIAHAVGTKLVPSDKMKVLQPESMQWQDESATA